MFHYLFISLFIYFIISLFNHLFIYSSWWLFKATVSKWLKSTYCIHWENTKHGWLYVPNVVFFLCFPANRKWNYLRHMSCTWSECISTSCYSCQSVTDLQGGNTSTYFYLFNYLFNSLFISLFMSFFISLFIYLIIYLILYLII